MKKTFLAALVVLLAMLSVTCDIFTPDDEIPSVKYTWEGGSLKAATIRLDGQGGPDRSAARALTDNLAKAGYDYYEVVFTDGTTVARASWELGDAASIKNVPRGAAGIDYVSAASAILFVGRMADKTLLAVGTLTGTDTGGTIVTPTTKTATFTVTSLTAGTNFAAGTSSFLTAVGGAAGNAAVPAAGDTEILTLTDNVSGKTFPLYHIAENLAQTNAIYTIEVQADSIAAYTPGIFVAAVPKAIQSKNPRFPRGGGLYYEVKGPFAASTTVAYTNATVIAGTGAFAPGITFAIGTNGAANQEGAISFTFEVPVYAITKTATPDGINYLTWYIRPGYGTNRYDLDDGTKSLGGAILLGVGSTTSLNYLDIIVIHP